MLFFAVISTIESWELEIFINQCISDSSVEFIIFSLNEEKLKSNKKAFSAIPAGLKCEKR